MMGEDEDGRVIRRIVAPPSFPAFVRPRAPDRSEHIAAKDPRADIVHPARCEVVVDAGRTTVLAEHFLKRPRRKHPFVQREAAGAKRIFEALTGPRAVA